MDKTPIELQQAKINLISAANKMGFSLVMYLIELQNLTQMEPEREEEIREALKKRYDLLSAGGKEYESTLELTTEILNAPNWPGIGELGELAADAEFIEAQYKEKKAAVTKLF